MAGQKLQIDIGTSYNGQGINKAKDGVSGLGSAMQTTSRNSGQLFQHIGKLSGQFGGLAGKAGQAANSIAGVISSVKGFGPLGMVVGGLFSVFMIGYEKVKKAEEERKRRLEEHAQKMREAYTEGALRAYQAHLQRVNEAENKRTAAIRKQVEAVNALNKAIKSRQEALTNLGKAKNDSTLAQLRRDNQTALDGVSDPTDRRITEAYGKAKEINYIGRRDTRYAEYELSRARNERANVGRQQASNLEHIQNLEALLPALEAKKQYAKTFKGSYGTAEEGQLRLKKATEDLERVQQKLIDAQNRRKILEQNMAEAELKVQTAQVNLDETKARSEFDNQQAKNEIRKAEEARQEQIYQEMAKEWAEEQAKQQKEMLRSEIEAMEYGQKEWNDRLDAVVKELESINKKEADIKKKMDERQKVINTSNSGSGSGLNGGNRYGQYGWETDDKGINSLSDIARARRMGAGQERDNASRREGYRVGENGEMQMNNLGRRRMDRLADLDRRAERAANGEGGKLSKREERERQNLRDWADQFPDKDRDARKKQLEEQKNDLSAKLKEAAKDITWKVKELEGLK